MEQIILKQNIRHINDQLIGKTIKDVSFSFDYENEDSFLILTFTDDTYIYLKAGEDYVYNDSDIKCQQIENAHALPLKCYPGKRGHIIDGIFEYYTFLEEEIRMKLIDADRDAEIKAVEQAKEIEREHRYKEYLKLKEEFEKW